MSRTDRHTPPSLSLLLALLVMVVACGEDVAPVSSDGGVDPTDAGDAAAIDTGVIDAPDLGMDGGGDLGADDLDLGADEGVGEPDAGDVLDAGEPEDAGMEPDAGPAAEDAGTCPDRDADGYAAAFCGGVDCDDTDPAVSPRADEICNAGRDDDCDGFADEADPDDTVCVPCPAGYLGVDGNCDNINECISAPCGDAATGCYDVSGSYVCTCLTGFAPSTPVGGACTNIDECAFAPCGGGTCVDRDGGYDCSCNAGYAPSGGPTPACLDVDECATGAAACSVTPVPAACSNTEGAYVCRCPFGYEGDGLGADGCRDVDECALGTDDCDDAPAAACLNSGGAFGCTCPPRFVGDAHGPSGCLLDDASLVFLGVSGASLTPAFSPGVLDYRVRGLRRDSTFMVTATAADPARAVLDTAGFTLPSGSPTIVSWPVGGFRPVLLVRVTTESGAVRTYRLEFEPSPIYVKASDTANADSFGAAVVMSQDGRTFVVGAPNDDATSANSGSVYVFVRTATSWSQQAKLLASNAGSDDAFGRALSLSADGNLLAVGAPSEDSRATGIGGIQTDNYRTGSGAAYLFQRTGAVWAQIAYIKPTASWTGSGPELLGDAFGTSIALSGDGSTLAIGSPGEDSRATGIGGIQLDDTVQDSGAVYVWRRAGITWTAMAYVKASNARTRALFGTSVALDEAGRWLVVGSPSDGSAGYGVDGNQDLGGLNANSGAAYVFERTGETLAQAAFLKASPGVSRMDARCGAAVAISADGLTIAVGAPGERGTGTGVDPDPWVSAEPQRGAVYTFSRASGAWASEAYLKSPAAAITASNDSFGAAVALSATGDVLASGVHLDSRAITGIDGSGFTTLGASGAVAMFRRTVGRWRVDADVKPPVLGSYDFFGMSVALSGSGQLVVGSRDEDSNATGIGGDWNNNTAPDSGAVFLY